MLRALRRTLPICVALRAASAEMSTQACEVRKVPYVLFGVGGVGAALVENIAAARKLHAERYGISFAAVGVCDSGAAVQATDGLSDEELAAILAHKGAGKPLKNYPSGVSARGDGESAADFLLGVATKCATDSPGCIVVDCTATDATVPSLLLAAGKGGVDARAVSANKKPFADSSMDVFKQLVLGARGPQRVRYESTVGAGLPVIASVQRVVAAADPVSLIAGSFSGTLGYVMSGLQAGGSFSDVVIKAKELGYTEPDPRDDLGGVDVARKALILARTLGMSLEMSDVTVEPLYPPALAELSVPGAPATCARILPPTVHATRHAPRATRHAPRATCHAPIALDRMPGAACQVPRSRPSLSFTPTPSFTPQTSWRRCLRSTASSKPRSPRRRPRARCSATARLSSRTAPAVAP